MLQCYCQCLSMWLKIFQVSNRVSSSSPLSLSKCENICDGEHRTGPHWASLHMTLSLHCQSPTTCSQFHIVFMSWAFQPTHLLQWSPNASTAAAQGWSQWAACNNFSSPHFLLIFFEQCMQQLMQSKLQFSDYSKLCPRESSFQLLHCAGLLNV